MSIRFVYPNVSELNRRGRGSLQARFNLAKETGCDFVEVPADFIKNKTEIELTGLELGSFLDMKAIHSLYGPQDKPHDIKYILHTEPSLPRTDGFGLSYQAPIKWYDQDWVGSFIDMIIDVSKYLKGPATAIEIHPGDRRNTHSHLLRACAEMLHRYESAFGVMPMIMLENRTGQYISTGKDLAGFWEAVSTGSGDVKSNVRIVLDVQQLFTVTRQDFATQFSSIPLNSIKGLHIHHKHRMPSLHDEIPWRLVFDRIRSSDIPLIINPEIHHQSSVLAAVAFCRSLLE